MNANGPLSTPTGTALGVVLAGSVDGWLEAAWPPLEVSFVG